MPLTQDQARMARRMFRDIRAATGIDAAEFLRRAALAEEPAQSIGTAELANLAVTTEKLDDDSVTATKVSDNAVTMDKLDNTTVASVVRRLAIAAGAEAVNRIPVAVSLRNLKNVALNAVERVTVFAFSAGSAFTFDVTTGTEVSNRAAMANIDGVLVADMAAGVLVFGVTDAAAEVVTLRVMLDSGLALTTTITFA